MRKFTIFTVILTVLVLVVAAEVIVDSYLPHDNEDVADNGRSPLPDSLDLSKTMETNLLGSDLVSSEEPVESFSSGFDLVYEEIGLSESEGLERGSDESGPVEVKTEVPIYSATTGTELDFEDENYQTVNHDVYFRDDQLKSAGFVGANLSQEDHNGFLFKTVYIDDLYDVEVSKSLIQTSTELLAKGYVFKVGSLSSVNEVYEVLKVRAAQGLDSEINETNEFGDASFYMNDARRTDVAFLVFRVSGLIYGFSYPKEYHPQIKNLALLIDYEF